MLSKPFNSSMTIMIKGKHQMMTKMMKSMDWMKTWLTVILIKLLIAISCSNAKFLKVKLVLMIINVDSILFVIIKFVKEMKMLSVRLKLIVRKDCCVSIIVIKKVHFIEEEYVQLQVQSRHSLVMIKTHYDQLYHRIHIDYILNMFMK